MLIVTIDRSVHHPIIFEMNVQRCRRRGALERKTNAPAPARELDPPPALAHEACGRLPELGRRPGEVRGLERRRD